jgi:cytochrome c553
MPCCAREIIFMWYKVFLLVTVFCYSAASCAIQLNKAQQQQLENCAACHGKDDKPANPEWPKLAGQHAAYMLQQLIEMQKGAQGQRNDAIMFSALQGIGMEDLQALAQLYSEQAALPATASANNIELGRQIYRGGSLKGAVPSCAACHGPNGEGNAPGKIPKLSGQNAAYIQATLLKYKQQTRKTDYNSIMRDIAEKMTLEDIAAVSNYIQGLS